MPILDFYCECTPGPLKDVKRERGVWEEGQKKDVQHDYDLKLVYQPVINVNGLLFIIDWSVCVQKIEETNRQRWQLNDARFPLIDIDFYYIILR